MADDVEGDGEAVEEFPVAVAKDHAPAIPEGVVVAVAVMHRGVEGHALVIDRVALEIRPEEIEGEAQPVEGLVGGRIAGRPVLLRPYDAAREGFAVICGV